jgi:hypothetical protein
MLLRQGYNRPATMENGGYWCFDIEHLQQLPERRAARSIAS